MIPGQELTGSNWLWLGPRSFIKRMSRRTRDTYSEREGRRRKSETAGELLKQTIIGL